MELQNLLLQNRSCRSFAQTPVTREQLVALVEAARVTPATGNLQPLKYYLSHTLEETASIQPLTHWAAKLPHLGLPREGHRPTAFVVICHDTTIAAHPGGFQRDVGIAALAILLRATEMGLAGCMIGNFDSSSLAKELKLPQHLLPQLVIGLGQPDEFPVLTQAVAGDTTYYRDEADRHYVPKRPLEELLLP